MLYLAIPAHNEVATIGVLLWRLRTVLAEFPREYEVVVYDDASTDDTALVAEQYERAMPVSVIRGATRLGYAGAVDALLRHVAGLTRYPRRDAVLLLQGDFTDPPGIVPEFARRFEGGADLVVGERLTVADAPTPVKRLFKYGHWAMRPFVHVEGVKDLTATMRLVRISALREAIRVAGSAALVSGDSWTANTDLLLRLAPHARKVESVPMEPTYGVRMRDTRRIAMADAISVLKWAWGNRSRRAVVGSSPADAGPEDRRSSRQNGKRREEPAELSVERIREKVRERDGSSGIDGEPVQDSRRRRPRERTPEVEADRPALRLEPAERPAERSSERPSRAERPERTPRGERPERERPERERPEREKRTETPRPDRPAREPREARPPRRREEPKSPYADATLELDDPFAPPSARRDARPLDTFMGASGTTEPAPVWVPIERQEADFGTAAPQPPEAEQAAGEAIETPRSGSSPSSFKGPAEESTGREAAADDDTERDDEALEVIGKADADAEGDDEAGELDAEGQPRRKRRRNRRSRRGRKKRDSRDGIESGAPGESGEAQDGEKGDDAVRFTPGDHIDGEPVRAARSDDDEGDDDADDSDDDGGGVESMSEGAARPRRRGRRGRRGGARRSRGKKDRPDGDSAPETGPDNANDGDAP